MYMYIYSNWMTDHVNVLVQDCSNSIANALESLQSCTKPLMCFSVEYLCERNKNLQYYSQGCPAQFFAYVFYYCV